MTDKTVSHAIERGIDFLFANRRFCGNEPRLWEDFDLLLGPSDEWVKAYAACALLHTNEERSVWAAREALHALVDRATQHRMGFGDNRRTGADGDSSAWVADWRKGFHTRARLFEPPPISF
jgi:hypothetical protein